MVAINRDVKLLLRHETNGTKLVVFELDSTKPGYDWNEQRAGCALRDWEEVGTSSKLGRAHRRAEPLRQEP